MNDIADMRAIYPSLKDRRVLITGGGSGIGSAIVEAFARQGAHVTFFDIDEEGSTLVASRCGAHFERIDLREVGALRELIESCIQASGPFDILVNNAGNDDRHALEDVTEAYWDDRLNANLKHYFFCAQAVLPGMRAKGEGAIVNVGSIAWHLAMTDLAVYQTAKAAIEGLTRALARELGSDGIRVNCVLPGSVSTPRQLKWYTPQDEAEIVTAQCLKDRLMPEDVAAMILFLSSNDARLVTGHNHFVDAGRL